MDDELYNLTRELSLEFFGKPYDGAVRWNSRLRSTAGRFLTRQKAIEVNPKYVEHFGTDSLLDVLKHELIHYHFPTAGHGLTFRREAARIGCSRFCLPLAVQQLKYIYRCRLCNKEYPRRRRIDVKKYRCSHCRGKLSLC